jgi:hypothetical protein
MAEIHSSYIVVVMPSIRTGAASDRQRLAALRRFLLLTLAAGSFGTGVELLFIGHSEDRLQFIPLVLLLGGLVVTAWHAFHPSNTSAGALRVVMTMFVAGGLLGIGLHYRSNEEFELEMNSSAAGVELVSETLTGAIPVLAPGSMVLLGLVGWAAVHGFSSGPTGGSGINEEDAS